MKNNLTITEIMYLKDDNIYSMLVMVNKQSVWINTSKYYVDMIFKFCHKIKVIEEETFIIYRFKK